MLPTKVILIFSLIIQKVYTGLIQDILEDNFIKKTVSTKYDFIIVGAGSAGCVLANRLSENSKWKVLLVEAGGVENPSVSIPATTEALQQTKFNWGYKAESTCDACLGMVEQRCVYFNGKGIGGTSLINYMIYNRGNRHDFDRWENAGNEGWSYYDVLPYFLKSERAKLKGLENSVYHNQKGQVSVQYVPYRSKIAKAFVDASKEAGHNETDYNGQSQMGTSYLQTNTLNGRRHSAAKAYLEPLILKRSNLKIITNAHVTKINISPTTKRAYGIEYVRNNKVYKEGALKEVILSTGALKSPQLLMLSGVGPKEHLEEIKVQLIKDLPVGRTLYDHVSHVGVTLIANTTGEAIHGENLADPCVIAEFTLNNTGKLTSIGGVEALTFIKTINSTEPSNLPDIELLMSLVTFASFKKSGYPKLYGLDPKIYNKVYKPLEDNNIDAFTLIQILSYPKSKGFIKLQDKNPFHPPLIYPEFLSNSEDVETLLRGVKETIRIINQPAMQRIGVRLHDIPLPGCDHIPFNTDDYWRCSIRTLTVSFSHQLGTCKMGPEDDPTSVVSPELKVHGIDGLRVADSSIIPEQLSSDTNAVSYMIGEKAADMIRCAWH